MGSRSKMMSSRPKNGTPPTGKRRSSAKIGGTPIVSEDSRRARKEYLAGVVKKKFDGWPPNIKDMRRIRIRVIDEKPEVYFRGLRARVIE